MGLVYYGVGTQWDWGTKEVGHYGTGTLWDWDTRGLGHTGTGTLWDWNASGLGRKAETRVKTAAGRELITDGR